MIKLEVGGDAFFFLFVLTVLCWAIPILMLIIGLVLLKRKPKLSKVLLIISGIWLLIGVGFCGFIMQ